MEFVLYFQAAWELDLVSCAVRDGKQFQIHFSILILKFLIQRFFSSGR